MAQDWVVDTGATQAEKLAGLPDGMFTELANETVSPYKLMDRPKAVISWHCRASSTEKELHWANTSPQIPHIGTQQHIPTCNHSVVPGILRIANADS